MLFEQKIKYLDYYEAGERVRGAGFIRMECWGDTCKIVIQVAGLFEEACGNHSVMITFGDDKIEIGKLVVEKGKGRVEIRNLGCADVSDGNGTELQIPVTEAEKILIPLGNNRELVAILRERLPESARSMEEATEKRKAATEEEEPSDQMTVTEEEVPADQMAATAIKEPADQMAATEAEAALDGGAGERSGREIKAAEAEVKAKVNGGEANKTPYSLEASLKPGKWEQLGAIYPRISPFGDSRKYLQISPGDFVILKDRSYRMVNNSFLLHGYFTYRHLILHRTNRNKDTVYYVGVPGTYYDKEKEVAILFGFESFEGAQEPAREGDFGYYMMRVEL